jgi:hypothetical protein
VTLEKVASGTLPHLLGKTLEGTLSPVLRGTEVRASHPMTGPGASHTGFCDHHKSRGALGFTHYQKAQGQPPYQYWSQHLRYSFLSQTQVLQKNYCSGISGQPLECYFTQPLACSWGDFNFCHSFLIVPETSTPLLG